MQANPANSNMPNIMSALESTLTSIMNDAASTSNKQANLVVAMFANEASYPNEVLLSMLRKSQTERTKAREDLLRDACGEYAKALVVTAEIKEKKKDLRTEKETFTLANWQNKIRAANIMFERAVATVVGLRLDGCQSVKASGIGAGALEIKCTDEVGDLIKYKMTAGAALAKATKTVNKELGRSNAEKDKKPRIVSTIEELNRWLSTQMQAAEPNKVETMADLKQPTQSALEKLLASLFALRFGVGDEIDPKAIQSYALSLVPHKDEAA